ncbi:mscS family protein [Nosema bombycis CQ1]|uniref:MscS family protein n=1 Tax=Nosema bombycis (strain CQ1 / CVCC 102059) TaxID=578461 RepID=R0MQ29_NOSB1|nr:mscS family protein [Nosema bombycis CQ1]|eukprot:EOB14968.1 mscS family protein [Nosema bombycis CQ1]
MINKMAGREMYDDVKEWATWVYNLLKYNQPELTRTCCRHFFNEKETEIIFNMFDSDANGVISLKEFIAVFFGVIREKYFLNESLLQKNTLLNKLSWVFSCISVPIGLFLASSVLGGAILVKNQVSTITGAILSLSFVFSAIAGEVFRSLIFIFLVRPFEAGDVLKIDDKILIVKELGLMYTSFTIRSLTNYVQNTKLMDKYIVNYRLSDVEEKVYTYTFHLRPFKTQLEKLESLIGTHLTSDTKKYTGTFYIRNYRQGKGSDITVDIVICFKINFQYVKGLIKNEDEFVFELEDMFKILKLEVL